MIVIVLLIIALFAIGGACIAYGLCCRSIWTGIVFCLVAGAPICAAVRLMLLLGGLKV
jgi:hypothetical protein